MSFRCPARTGEAGRPHSVSNQPVSFEFDSPPRLYYASFEQQCMKASENDIYPPAYSASLPDNSSTVSRAGMAASKLSNLAGADILHCGPTSYGLQSIQSIQPGNSSAAERYNPSNNTSGKVQQFVQSILYQHLHICIHSLNVKDGTLYPAPNLLTFSITYYFACIHFLNCISCT